MTRLNDALDLNIAASNMLRTFGPTLPFAKSLMFEAGIRLDHGFVAKRSGPVAASAAHPRSATILWCVSLRSWWFSRCSFQQPRRWPLASAMPAAARANRVGRAR
jgi:hypothetical protein